MVKERAGFSLSCSSHWRWSTAIQMYWMYSTYLMYSWSLKIICTVFATKELLNLLSIQIPQPIWLRTFSICFQKIFPFARLCQRPRGIPCGRQARGMTRKCFSRTDRAVRENKIQNQLSLGFLSSHLPTMSCCKFLNKNTKKHLPSIHSFLSNIIKDGQYWEQVEHTITIAQGNPVAARVGNWAVLERTSHFSGYFDRFCGNIHVPSLVMNRFKMKTKSAQTSNFNWKTWPSNFSSTLLAPSHQEYYLDQRGWEPGKVKEGCTSTYFQCRLSATLGLSVTNTNTNTQIHARRNLKILKWKIQRRYVY